ncbi:MAG: (d)CMP kinase [Candidatus Omnitrophica bacterium]|jgi:cytidylate kinase|nr:(d)CMP kinase [Candidatus Omnitrophota bacterium]
MIIAIDGPAGSGKTTIAKLLAQSLNISYLDTGATYRALTYVVLKKGLDSSDSDTLRKVAESLNLEIKEDRIYLDGKDISQEIRMPDIDRNISLIVSYPKVREVMRELQRKIAQGKSFVVEGRDTTTVVFPQAEYKFYLDADSKVRAQRRFKELKAKGVNIDFETLFKDLEKRDYSDKNRKHSPLVISKEAIYIDTSNLDIPQTVEELKRYIKLQ